MNERLKHKTLYHKTLVKNVKKFIDVGLDNNFLEMMPRAEKTKAKIKKWDYIKRKSSAQQKKQKMKWQPKE